ncbi:YhbY family RNA-binding protein [soil metagenome]
MASLTARQRAHLKTLAHPLKPIMQIGKDGLTDAVARTVEDAFHTRELLKIKVLEAAPAGAREIGDALAGALGGVHLVQVIGRTLVLYRRHADKPEIVLPGASR